MATTVGFGSNKFFRLTLLNGNVQEITDLLGSMDREVKSIEKEISSLVYYMNGGLTYDSAYTCSMEQLHVLSDVIKTHYDKQAEAYNSANINKR